MVREHTQVQGAPPKIDPSQVAAHRERWDAGEQSFFTATRLYLSYLALRQLEDAADIADEVLSHLPEFPAEGRHPEILSVMLLSAATRHEVLTVCWRSPERVAGHVIVRVSSIELRWLGAVAHYEQLCLLLASPMIVSVGLDVGDAPDPEGQLARLLLGDDVEEYSDEDPSPQNREQRRAARKARRGRSRTSR